MGNQAAIFTRRRPARGDWIAKQDYLLRQGILKLLAVKDSDIRILTLEQGFGVAQGFAIAGRTAPRFDSYCMSGDGELQEGPIWEAVMFAGSKKLDNLCLLVDRNYGQLDLANRMIFPMPELEPVFTSFGWQAHTVDATQYDGVYTALEQFRYGPRNGKPTAIICHATKGHGALSDFLNKHEVTVADKLMEQELALQSGQRRDRVEEFTLFYPRLEEHASGGRLKEALIDFAGRMHLEF